MNGLFELNIPEDLFKKAQQDYESFCDNPNDYDLFNLLTTITHLRDWICPSGYNSYKNKIKSIYTKEEKIHSKLYENKNFKIIKELCNNSKHFNDSGIGVETEILNGFICDFSVCGDRLGQRNYLVEGQDLRDILNDVFFVYNEYFAK